MPHYDSDCRDLHFEENISKALLVETKIDIGIFSSFEYINRDSLQNACLFVLINRAKKERDWLNVFDDKIYLYIS